MSSQPLVQYNTFAELQKEICDIVNQSPELKACGAHFMAENELDIEYQISNAMKKQGLACVVMTPDAAFQGTEGNGCVYQLNELTLQICEYPPINRASNRQNVATGLDIANYCAEMLAGPNAVIGFGQLSLNGITQGEDNGLLVTKVSFKTLISNNGIPPYIFIPYVTPDDVSSMISSYVGDGKLNFFKDGVKIAQYSANQKNDISVALGDAALWGQIRGNIQDQTDLWTNLQDLSSMVEVSAWNLQSGLDALAQRTGEVEISAVALKAITDALQASKADRSELDPLAVRDNIEITYNSKKKKIILDADGNKSEIDATDFIKDGMIDTVEYDHTTHRLTITFNTAAGKDPIVIDLSDLVNTYQAADGVKLRGNTFRADWDVVASRNYVYECTHPLSTVIRDVLSAAIDRNYYATQTNARNISKLSATKADLSDIVDYTASDGVILSGADFRTDWSKVASKAEAEQLSTRIDNLDNEISSKADISSIGNAKVSIYQGIYKKGEFYLNQKNDLSVYLLSSGGGGGGSGEAVWGSIDGYIDDQMDLRERLDSKAPLSGNAEFTGPISADFDKIIQTGSGFALSAMINEATDPDIVRLSKTYNDVWRIIQIGNRFDRTTENLGVLLDDIIYLGDQLGYIGPGDKQIGQVNDFDDAKVLIHLIITNTKVDGWTLERRLNMMMDLIRELGLEIEEASKTTIRTWSSL